MAEIDLAQVVADSLIAIEKHRANDEEYVFPIAGGRVTIPLTSSDNRESFLLDVNRARIKLTKATYQNRARQVIVLMRLDLDGPPHRNPDGEEISCPHLHIYREGYGSTWAIPAPPDIYSNPSDLISTFQAFMSHCNITLVPNIQWSLF